MHANRFSFVKQSTQGLVGDVLSKFFGTEAFGEDEILLFRFSVVVIARVLISFVIDFDDDVAISTLLSFDEFAGDDPASNCSRSRASTISFIQTFIFIQLLGNLPAC